MIKIYVRKCDGFRYFSSEPQRIVRVRVLFSFETIFVYSKLPGKRQVCRSVLHQLKCKCLLGKKRFGEI